MKNLTLIAAVAALVMTGCGPSEEPTANSSATTPAATTAAPAIKAVSYEKGTKKKGDKGVCAVCMIKAGKETEEEEVKLTLDYNDKTYVFCNEAEEAEFISDPKKFAGG